MKPRMDALQRENDENVQDLLGKRSWQDDGQLRGGMSALEQVKDAMLSREMERHHSNEARARIENFEGRARIIKVVRKQNGFSCQWHPSKGFE